MLRHFITATLVTLSFFMGCAVARCEVHTPPLPVKACTYQDSPETTAKMLTAGQLVRPLQRHLGQRSDLLRLAQRHADASHLPFA